MISKTRFLTFIVLFFYLSTNSQGNFQFFGTQNKKQTVKFKLINNLIIIPLEINGKKLNFILDSGVNKTILFNLSKNDSIGLKNVNKVRLQGLGSGDAIDALLSKKNTFKIANLISTNENLYVVLKDEFDLSGKMGITIHGIIGYRLLKNTITNINYKQKKIHFYNPVYYKKRKCRKCTSFPLQFYRNKPYININAQIDTLTAKQTALKMLIDLGGSDAMWLFEGTKREIKTPIKHFNDILGEGLSGTIYGKRSRIPQLSIGNFKLKTPTVSFLDSVSTHNARKFSERNGSIGGEILKRFNIWIDYPNKNITFKKCTSLKEGFYYNMSGLSVVYSGKQLIREEEASKVLGGYNINNQSSSDNTISFITSYSYKFKPSFKINKVLKDSPAGIAGILKDDVILKINNRLVHNYTLDEIVAIFHTKPNKKIKMQINRGGLKLNFEFRLKKRI